jgi:mRNA interferase MazF
LYWFYADQLWPELGGRPIGTYPLLRESASKDSLKTPLSAFICVHLRLITGFRFSAQASGRKIKYRSSKMEIQKGSIYWIDNGKQNRSPALVIQNDVLNASKLSTVSLVAITPTLKFGELPGNVVLDKGEANMPQKCVVNVSQIKTVDKASVGEKIGTLSPERMTEIHNGLKLVIDLP